MVEYLDSGIFFEMDPGNPRCPPGLRAYQTMMQVDREARLANQDRLRGLVRDRERPQLGGKRVDERADFRAYGSVAESFADYTRLIGRDRYAAARGTGDDVHRFASALQKAGYATDPSYAAKITAIANGATLNRALAAMPTPRHGAVAMPEILTTSEGPGHTVGLAPRELHARLGEFLVPGRVGAEATAVGREDAVGVADDRARADPAEVAVLLDRHRLHHEIVPPRPDLRRHPAGADRCRVPRVRGLGARGRDPGARA